MYHQPPSIIQVSFRSVVCSVLAFVWLSITVFVFGKRCFLAETCFPYFQHRVLVPVFERGGQWSELNPAKIGRSYVLFYPPLMVPANGTGPSEPRTSILEQSLPQRISILRLRLEYVVRLSIQLEHKK